MTPEQAVFPNLTDDIIPRVDDALARFTGGIDPLLRVRREILFQILQNPERPAILLFLAAKGKPLAGPGSRMGVMYEIPNFGEDQRDVDEAVAQACAGLRSMKAAQGNGQPR